MPIQINQIPHTETMLQLDDDFMAVFGTDNSHHQFDSNDIDTSSMQFLPPVPSIAPMQTMTSNTNPPAPTIIAVPPAMTLEKSNHANGADIVLVDNQFKNTTINEEQDEAEAAALLLEKRAMG